VRTGLDRRVVGSLVMGAVWALAVSGSWAQDQRDETGAARAESAPSGNTTNGAALYLKDGCWECHGYSGANGSGAPLVLSGLNESGFVRYLRNPRTTGMPLYSTKVLSDAEAADLYAYIKTFKRPVDAKDIPLLQQIIDEN